MYIQTFLLPPWERGERAARHGHAGCFILESGEPGGTLGEPGAVEHAPARSVFHGPHVPLPSPRR